MNKLRLERRNKKEPRYSSKSFRENFRRRRSWYDTNTFIRATCMNFYKNDEGVD